MAGHYDKILKEGLKGSIAGLLRRVIGLDYAELVAFVPKLQYTLEREADFFAVVTDKNDRKFVVHLEFQSADEAGMVWRMFQYRGLISQKYALPVKQYVIYLGAGPTQMPAIIEEEDLSFRFNLIEIRQIPYRVFLQSDQTSEMILAILGNLQGKSVEQAVADIVQNVVQLKPQGLEREQAIRQLEVLAQLRGLQNIVAEKISTMALDFFDIKKDPRYLEGRTEGKLEGRPEGKLEGRTEGKLEGRTEGKLEGRTEGKLEGRTEGELAAKTEAIQRALAKGKLTVDDIADIQNVSVQFVEDIRRKLNAE